MPICFEVQVNDEPPVLAGARDISVLVAGVTFVASHNDLELRVGGLFSRDDSVHENVEWIERNVALGDRVVLRIVDAPAPSDPVRRRVDEPEFREAEERKYYEQLKKKYEP